MKFKILLIFFIIYFLITSYICTSIAWTFLTPEEIETVKESFNLHDEKVILIYNRPLRFKRNLVIVYEDVNNNIQIKERGFSDSFVKELSIVRKIQDNDIVKYCWYVNILNIIILLIYKIKEKNKYVKP